MLLWAKKMYWRKTMLPKTRQFREDPSSPWLISFPRTGSHWLRMILELYADRPSLPRSFFTHSSDRFLLMHTHDYPLAKRPQRMIYLYRDPEPVVFSQIMYHQDDPFDPLNVEVWASMYRAHLLHWTQREWPERVLVRYEDMQSDLASAVQPVLSMLELPVDAERLADAAQKATPERVVQNTTDNPRIINQREDYAQLRRRFLDQMGPLVRQLVVDRPGLQSLFPTTRPLRAAG